MNIKTRPLMMGAGAGAALLILFSIATNIGNYLWISSDPSSLSDPTNPVSLVLSCLGFVCPIIAVIGAGFIYGRMAGQEAPMETQDVAIGGAATGAATGVIFGVVNAILSIIISQFFLADILAEASADLGVEGLGGIMAAGGVIGGLFASCCWLIVGAILGAVGGIIANAMANRGQA